jgi:hypothetical protein
MTRMSEPVVTNASRSGVNPLESHEGSRLAHPVHGSRANLVMRVVLPLGLGGCIFPPQLEVENLDAGINSPPAITAVRSDDSELPEPGPVVFNRGDGSINVELIDTDLTDTLFVRAFIDYSIGSNETAPRVVCTSAPNNDARRTATCNASALCLPGDVGVRRNMHIAVFDREPLEGEAPQFQAMPPGGLSTNRFYFLECQDALP